MRDIINEIMNEFERCTDDYKPFTSLVLLGSNNEDNFDSAMKMNDPRCHLDLHVSLDLFRRLPSVITKIDKRNPDHLALAERSSDIASAYSSSECAYVILLRALTLMLTIALSNRK